MRSKNSKIIGCKKVRGECLGQGFGKGWGPRRAGG